MTKLSGGVPLFRPEAVEHKKNNVLGEVLLDSPKGINLLSAMCGLFIGLLVYLLGVAEFSQYSTATGWLDTDPPTVRVSATVAGTIAVLHASEGTRVTAGSPLVTLTSSRHLSSGEEFAQKLIELKGEIRNRLTKTNEVRSQLVKSRVERVERELALFAQSSKNLRIQLDLTETRLSLSRESLARARNLVESGHLANHELAVYQDTVVQHEISVSSLRQQQLELAARIESLKGDLEAILLQSELEQGADFIDGLAVDTELVEIRGSSEMVINSPVSGTVTGLVGRTGELVQPGAELLTVIPDGARLYADLQIPAGGASYVEAGQKIQLQYDAYPYQRYGTHQAVITHVGGIAAGVADAAKIGPPTVRVIAELESQVVLSRGVPYQLRPGMTLRTQVPTEVKTILGRMLDPLYRAVN